MPPDGLLLPFHLRLGGEVRCSVFRPLGYNKTHQLREFMLQQLSMQETEAGRRGGDFGAEGGLEPPWGCRKAGFSSDDERGVLTLSRVSGPTLPQPYD